MSRQIDKVQIIQVVEDQLNKGVTNGYAALNASGDISTGDLPSTGINADTLDSLNSTQFIRSDANDTFSGTLNYTTDTGVVLSFDGKTTLQRHTAQGAISFGCDDALVVANGESRAETVANVDMVSEQTHLSTDVNLYIYTAMQSGWATRNTFTFSESTFNAPNIQENGTNLSSKYLGISAKAVDSDKLGTESLTSTDFLRSNTVDTASSKITFATGLARNAHNTGFLEGSYNNVGENSAQSNPIYTIGSAYNPGTTTLGNMYGIGYSHDNASFINPPGSTGWGMYVAYAGNNPNIWLDGSYGIMTCTGSMYEAGTALSSKYLGIIAKAADSALLNAATNSTGTTGNTIAQRNSSGYLYASFFNASNVDTTAAATRVVIGYDNFLRWQSKSSFISGMGLLTTTGKAADSNLLDAIDSTGFCRAGARTDNYVWIRRSSNESALFVTQQSSGYIQAWYQGTVDGTLKSYVANNGTIYAPDQYLTSDVRLKENIKDLQSYLDISLKIADIVRVYDRKDIESKDEIGFVAQELEKIAPQFVSQAKEGEYKGVKYQKMVTPLYKTIKEQNNIIKKQQARLKILKNNVRYVEELISML